MYGHVASLLNADSVGVKNVVQSQLKVGNR